MDLVLSFTIQKFDEINQDYVYENTGNSDWLNNANADLVKQFSEERTKHTTVLADGNEIKVDSLDICYQEGQYYLISAGQNFPIADKTKIRLPGYVLTAHIHNTSQVNNLVEDTRFSEELLDFDNMFVDPDAIENAVSEKNEFSNAIDAKQNDLLHYMDLPQMIGEDNSYLEDAQADREKFHQQIIPAAPPAKEANILYELGIQDDSHDFFNYMESRKQNTQEEQFAPIGIVDEIYEDSRQSIYYETVEGEKGDVKKGFRHRLSYLKKAIVG